MAVRVASLFLVMMMMLTSPAAAQSPTVSAFWPGVEAHVSLPQNWGALGFVGLKRGEDFPYQQFDAGVGIGYRWRVIMKPHIANIDPEKEHVFIVGGGYERLQTFQSGASDYENRLALQGLLGFRLTSPWYVSDRNRVEFRWINGTYSARYRNLLFSQYDLDIHGFRFSPYASAEVFYNEAAGSWNEQQYSGGIEWPYRRRLMLQTYYLRQNCTSCNPAKLNVGGITLHVFF